MIWKMIWSLSTWAHLAGCFTITTVAMRFVPSMFSAVFVVALGSVILELYQHKFQPDYPTKRADTVLDLIADGIGIVGAVAIAL